MRCRKEVCFFVKRVMKESKTFCFTIFGIFLSVFAVFGGENDVLDVCFVWRWP